MKEFLYSNLEGTRKSLLSRTLSSLFSNCIFPNFPSPAEYADWKRECEESKEKLHFQKVEALVDDFLERGCNSDVSANCSKEIRDTDSDREATLTKDIKDMENRIRCDEGSHFGCQLTFYHNGINSDTFLSSRVAIQ